MINLDQIITAQVDEPMQKSCIYKVKRAAAPDKRSPQYFPTSRESNPSIKLPGNDKGEAERGSQYKFTQIRVKSIEFLE